MDKVEFKFAFSNSRLEKIIIYYLIRIYRKIKLFNSVFDKEWEKERSTKTLDKIFGYLFVATIVLTSISVGFVIFKVFDLDDGSRLFLLVVLLGFIVILLGIFVLYGLVFVARNILGFVKALYRTLTKLKKTGDKI